MYYSTIDKFFSDLHDLLSEDQNRGYPLIYRGPFNPPAERYMYVDLASTFTGSTRYIRSKYCSKLIS